MAGWSFKQLNIAVTPHAPAAAMGTSSIFLQPGTPFVSQYNGQMHVAYATDSGMVWDIWCTPFPSVPAQWNQQRIDQDGSQMQLQTWPSVGVYQDQQHFCYVRSGTTSEPPPVNGTIYDSFYDGSHWHPQQIGDPAVVIYGNFAFTPPYLVSPVLVSVWDVANQQHFTYLTGSVHDNIIVDAFYDGAQWHSQQINNGGNTEGPSAYSKVFSCVFTPPTAPYLPPTSVAGQQHIAYLGGDGSIWDAWFDGQTGHSWVAQKLNFNGKTNAPAATGGPYVWVVPENTGFPQSPYYHNQQHFTYQANGGAIWDVWYDFPTATWNVQKFNIDAASAPYHTTNAPAAAGNPAALTVGNMLSGKIVVEQHVAYRDNTGAIWDLWYDGSPQWQCRKVNMGGETTAPPAIADPFLFYYPGVDNDGTVYGQLHVAWQAQGGQIWDAWFDLNPIPGQPGGRAGP
jgi:hypothetical protein